MRFSLKPDFDESLKRYEAFWAREVIDRPPVALSLPKEDPAPVPSKVYPSLREQWLDVDFRAEQAAVELANRQFLGDGLPIVYPNFGPEFFSALCGCGLTFGETTSWSEPCIADWERDAPRARLDWTHPLLQAMDRFYDQLLERARGTFIVGLTDFHPGGDHLAALRDPANLAMDMIDHPDEIAALLAVSQQEYFALYDHFYHRLKAAGMPSTSWLPLIDDAGRYYIPSNDFSCMISKAMFDEVFLPGIQQECRFYHHSIYHLDGPGALRHLDSLLEIPELDAIQWVCGAGNEGYAKWAPVYQRIQAAGKGLALYPTLDELPMIFETLRPEGVFFDGIAGVDSAETAQRVLARIAKWA